MNFFYGAALLINFPLLLLPRDNVAERNVYNGVWRGEQRVDPARHGAFCTVSGRTDSNRCTRRLLRRPNDAFQQRTPH